MKIEARGLRRTFRTFERRPGLVGAVRDLLRLRSEERVALHGLDLDIEPGERVALIGPNGAGKSTTVKLCCGILAPTTGELRIGGRQPHRQRRAHVRHIGVVFGQRTQLWWDLPVREAFSLLGAIFEVPQDVLQARIARMDEVLDLGPLLGSPVRELSLGQRMRCDLAAAMLHGPSVLFLDEPTIGLDVAVKHRMRALLRELDQDRPVTVVLTTHDLGDVEAVCERVVLLDRGEKLFDGTTAALKDSLGGRRRLRITLDGAPDDPTALTTGLPGRATWPADETVLIELDGAQAASGELIAALLERAEAQGRRMHDLAVEEVPIEQVVARFYEDRGRAP